MKTIRKDSIAREPVDDSKSPPARWILPLLLLIYVLLTGLLAVRVPIGAAPDEFAHMKYVEHLATLREFPVFKPLGSSDAGYEFHQPPLYYGLCALFWNAAGAGVQNYACRAISLLFGAATIALVWAAVRALFPYRPGLEVLAAGFTALLPLHQAIGAAAGNDAMAGFFCALLFYLIAGGVADSWSWRRSAMVGLAIGLAMLTKSSSLTVAVAALGAACHLTWRESDTNDRLRKTVFAFVTVSGIAGLVCGWWLMRNTSLYGDPLALGIFDRAFRNSSPGPAFFFANGVSVPTYLRALGLIMFCTTWGFFGGPNSAGDALQPFNVNGGPPLNPAIALLMAVCALAMVLPALGFLRWKKSQETDLRTDAVKLWLALGTLAVWLAWVNFNLTYYQAQARYLHPALLPMVVAWAIGWHEILATGTVRGRVVTGVLAAVAVIVTCWNIFGWRTLV